MKKLFALALAVIMIFSMAACGGENGEEGKTPVEAGGENVSQGNKSGGDEPRPDVTVEKQVVYDENDIKITVTSLDTDTFMGAELKVLVENNSDRNITVQARNVSVNDIMVDPIFSADVSAGKKSNDEISFMSAEFETANIKTVKSVELSFHIFDSDEWETLYDTDPVVVTTSADDSVVQQYDDSGYEAVNENGLRIVIKKLDDKDSFWGADVLVYIENNSGDNVTVQTRDVSVNGFMVNPVFSCDVQNGKKAFSDITFFESELKDNDITDITDIELVFHVFDTESWKTIFDTDIVKVSFDS